MDHGEVTSLILLDLSAASDTIDHSILLTCLQNCQIGLVLTVFLLISSRFISHQTLQVVYINDFTSEFTIFFCYVVYPKVPYLAHSFSLYTTPPGSVISQNSLKYQFICWWHPDVHLFHSNKLCLQRLSILLPPLLLTFSPGWIWTNYSSIHQQLNFFSLAQNNNISNLLILQTYLLAMLSSQWPSQFLCSQSWLRLRLLACLSLIKSTLYITLLWHFTSKSHQTSTHSKLIGTCHYKHFRIPTHQQSKNYTGFQSNKESITNLVFSHTKP